MKRFDMHIHCADQFPDPEKLLAQMDACGIYGGILMSQYPKESKSDGFDAETRMNQVLDACKKHPDRLFPVLWIHPHEPNALEVAEEAVRRGIMASKCFVITTMFPIRTAWRWCARSRNWINRLFSIPVFCGSAETLPSITVRSIGSALWT